MTRILDINNMSRRKLLLTAAVALPVTALATLSAEAKVAPGSVMYKASPKDGHDCKGCKLFEAPSSCKQVSGTISPNGWCMLWSAKA